MSSPDAPQPPETETKMPAKEADNRTTEKRGNSMDTETDQPSPLERHQTDMVAFVFGILFLIVTAIALLAQLGSLEDAAAWSWAAGAVLMVAGLAAVVGTLVSSRRSTGTSAD